MDKDYIKYLDIPKKWNLKNGDVVFISSDILDIGISCIKNGEKFNPNKFIDSIIEIIGPTGTLLFPTYNWDFCHGETFDYYKTPCKTGGLGVTALKRPDFRRTQHPIYSFAVWGKDQDYLCGLTNKSSFGEDSPFGYLKRVNAVNIVVNVPLYHSFTFGHHIEQTSVQELEGIAWRYHKNFTSNYRDSEGHEEERTYSMFVRYLDMEELPPREEELRKQLQLCGAMTVVDINGIEYKRIELGKAVPGVKNTLITSPYYGRVYTLKS